MQDVIKRFLKDIENGNLSEQEAFKNLCDTVNKQMKLAIANVTTNANEELKEWDHLMANFSNLSESKFSAIECEASQFNIGEELPDDKYNPWTDPWSYFTCNFAKSAGVYCRSCSWWRAWYVLKHLELNCYALQEYYFIEFYVITSDSCRWNSCPCREKAL